MVAEHRFYTIPEFAEIARVSQSHAYELVRQGEVPAVKLGRRRLIPASYIDSLDPMAQSTGAAYPEQSTSKH